MACGGDQHLGLNNIGVHAHLGVVVQGHQGPVGDSTPHVAPTDRVFPHNQVLTRSGVEELDIGSLRAGYGMSNIDGHLVVV